MDDQLIARATIDPKVKAYWLVFAVCAGLVTVVGIVLIPVLVLLVLLISQKIIDATSVDLYTRKLVVKRGVLFKVEKTIPLEKITDVALSQGPLMRAFNLNRLNFETAGQSGPGALVSVIGIVDAENFREQILEQKNKISADRPKEASPQDQLGAILDSLLRIESILLAKGRERQ